MARGLRVVELDPREVAGRGPARGASSSLLSTQNPRIYVYSTSSVPRTRLYWPMGYAVSSSIHAKQRDAALLEARLRGLYVVAEHAEPANLRVFDVVRAAHEALLAHGQRVHYHRPGFRLCRACWSMYQRSIH